MSSSQTSAPETFNVSYNFVIEKSYLLEKYYDSESEHPGLGNNIVINSIESDKDTQMTGTTDHSGSLTDDGSTPKSQMEKYLSIAHSEHCIPCMAYLTWRNQKLQFFCLYEWHTKRFTLFELDKSVEYKRGQDFWPEQHIEISHLPQGFLGHGMQAAVMDDRGNAMLFVKMDTGAHCTVKLYGKMAAEGEWRGTLTKGERKRLGLPEDWRLDM